ncbi:MAG: Diaminopimelate epimerase [Lentisphaerae bacterium ADurb.BinA184]|nr:MAG: Diaminopimelate epimerase [Lentisphaerae bacterium ADurb.BinA184]
MPVTRVLPDRIAFVKLNSAGNDFICLDNLAGAYDGLLASGGVGPFVRHLCRRGLSVGADGVVFALGAEGLAGADIVARFFEPDGSEAKLCGNGAACFTYWAVRQALVAGPDVCVLTRAGTARGRVNPAKPRQVRVCIPDPGRMQRNLHLDVAGETVTLDTLDTGVPHAVVAVEGDLDAVEVSRLGAAIRHHPRFAPDGVNVNFVKVIRPGHLAIRTFEFGVEAETLACGTGSAAAAILSALRNGWPDEYRHRQSPVRVRVRSGDELMVWFEARDGNDARSVCLDTHVTPVYEAELTADVCEDLLALTRAAAPQHGSFTAET